MAINPYTQESLAGGTWKGKNIGKLGARKYWGGFDTAITDALSSGNTAEARQIATSHGLNPDLITGSVGGGASGVAEEGVDFKPEFSLPEGSSKYMGMWDDLYARTQKVDPTMASRWDKMWSKATVDPAEIASFADQLRALEEPFYAEQDRQARLAAENRLLSQGMLGSTGGGIQTGALLSSQADAALRRQTERLSRGMGYRQQGYQNLLAALTGQQGFQQQNLANQISALAGSGGLFTGLHQIGTQRGLGSSEAMLALISQLMSASSNV